MIPHRAVACLATFLLLGCDHPKGTLGSWALAAIDGVAPGASTALRVPVPAGTYDTLDLSDGWMWKEYVLDSLVLELESDGTFRERKVEASSAGVTRSSFGLVRPDYAPMFGGELNREEAIPSVQVIDGTWSEGGDTLRLTVTREALLADIVANLSAVLPDVPDAIRGNVEGSVPQEMGPRWVGVRKGDRLELTNPEGRQFVFRRPGDAR